MIDRKEYIGGPDAATLCGLNPWSTPYEIWARKTGRVGDVEMNEKMELGLLMEEPILKHYEKREGVHLDYPGTVIDDGYKYLGGSPDAEVRGQNKGVEAKLVGMSMASKFGEDGSDEVAELYFAQCQWYMGLMDYPLWDLCALIGTDYKVFHLERDPEIIGLMRDRAHKFWKDHVLADVPPEVAAGDTDVLKKMFPQNQGSFRMAEPEDMINAELLRGVRQGEAALKEQKAVLENTLKERIQDADGLDLGEDGKITWRRSKDGTRVDTKSLLADPDMPKDLVEKHTVLREGSRRFLCPRQWLK